MKKSIDTLIVGGGIIGMSTAYNLVQLGEQVALAERAHLGSGSTGRCIGGLRQQFSTPSSIGLMQESMSIFAEMADEFGFDIEFDRSGYLLLAHSEKTMTCFRRNVALQQSLGVSVSLLTPAECQALLPHLCLDDLIGAAYCPDDGQAYPFSVLRGFSDALRSNSAHIITHNPVESIACGTHFTATLRDGSRIEAEKLLVAAGAWSADLLKGIGLDLPLYPERHEAVISERLPPFLGPMLVDYRPDGCYFQQLLTGQIIGCYTPVPNVPGIHEDVSLEFLPQVARRMVRLVPALERASFLRHWSGCYTMTPDGNPIVDESPIERLYVASGMCGHGFMFGPAIGKHLAIRMTTGAWQRDFSEFAIDRAFVGQETLK